MDEFQTKIDLKNTRRRLSHVFSSFSMQLHILFLEWHSIMQKISVIMQYNLLVL